LPVELIQFTAKPQQSTALLQWRTGSETACAHFAIQQSPDGLSWQTLGEIPCKGGGYPYAFTDKKPYKGLNYYRLEQFDYSGKSYFSPIRVISMASTGYTLRIASGEGKAFFEIVGEHASEYTWQLEICALDGRVLQSRAVGAKGWLELPELPTGVYLAIVHNADGIAVATEKWWWTR
jgi:hypothetical protein